MIGKLKIVAVSDLHGYLPEITESADIAIVAGDMVPLAIQFDKPASQRWFETEFAFWILSLPVDQVFMVAGNHDALLESITYINLSKIIRACEGKLIYLKNESVDYFDDNGLMWTIFGTPYCHIYGNWPFMRSEEYMIEAFKKIPDKVDILISHDPPYAVGDADVILESSRSPMLSYQYLGNPALALRIQHVNYKLLVCGHIHGGDHELNTWFKIVNVSLLNEGYKPVNKPFYTEIEHDW